MKTRTFTLLLFTSTLIACGDTHIISNDPAADANKKTGSVLKEAVTEITMTGEFSFPPLRHPNKGMIRIHATFKHDPKIISKHGNQPLPCDVEEPNYSKRIGWSVSEDKKTFSFDMNSPIQLFNMLRVGDVPNHEELLLGKWVNSLGNGTESTLEENHLRFFVEKDLNGYDVYKFEWTKKCSLKFDSRSGARPDVRLDNDQ